MCGCMEVFDQLWTLLRVFGYLCGGHLEGTNECLLYIVTGICPSHSHGSVFKEQKKVFS